MPRENELESGFEPATSENIPEVDFGMVHDYYCSNPLFVSPEIRGSKNVRNCDESQTAIESKIKSWNWDEEWKRTLRLERAEQERELQFRSSSHRRVNESAPTPTGVGGLRSVWLKVPVAVAPGQSATLECNYDLEGEPLYTVKWYKGRQEFFRYIPKEHPHTRVFPLPGVSVDLNASGPKMVVLRDVRMELAGRYRCEVSSDAPNFHTEVVSALMHVVHMLEGDPVVRLEKSRYSVGDVLRGNCTSPPSNPPANITWFINCNKINASYISKTPVAMNKMVTQAGLEYEVNTFTQGKMKVTCKADVYGVYETQTEITLDEEKPRLASVRGSGSDRTTLSIPLAVAVFGLMLATRR